LDLPHERRRPPPIFHGQTGELLVLGTAALYTTPARQTPEGAVTCHAHDESPPATPQPADPLQRTTVGAAVADPKRAASDGH